MKCSYPCGVVQQTTSETVALSKPANDDDEWKTDDGQCAMRARGGDKVKPGTIAHQGTLSFLFFTFHHLF
jgi:hypothetical protein